MRWTKAFIPTLRDNPADAEFPAHQLLLRGGFVRQLAAGIYSYLPLGQRVLLKIVDIIREEFAGIGAQEFLLPVLHPTDLWQEKGRWTEMGENMFRLKDRAGRDLCLGMTHEEVFAGIARGEIRSYKELPQIWYQIQSKFRDEPRPRSGLLRLRQFTMKDSYSFDVDRRGLDESYQRHLDAYHRILTRCGLAYQVSETGPMADGTSQELVARADAGEEPIVSCECGYTASLESALSTLPVFEDAPPEKEPWKVHTPGQKTIAEIAGFLHVPPTHQIKSLVYMIDGKPHLFLLRGDHQLNEAKLASALRNIQLRPATPGEIEEAFGAEAGSLGPIGAGDIPVYADIQLKGRKNLTCGANVNDYHLQGVTPDVHFNPVWTDLRTVQEGENCTRCGKPLTIYKAVRLGHLSKLGTRYSESMGALVLTPEGKQVPIQMGSYGLGLERLVSCAIEQHHDSDGIAWPRSIAPYSVILTPVNYRDETKAAADNLYEKLRSAGIDVLLDDRKERPGVKFKDADLIGIPYRVILGAEKLKQGNVELFERSTGETTVIPIGSVIPELTGAKRPNRIDD